MTRLAAWPLGLVLLAAALPASALRPDGGDALMPGDAADHVSAELDRKMAEDAARNLARLRAEGRLPATIPPKVSGLVWPLGPNPGAGMDYHGISNFVDLEPAYPNQLRDYTCSNRTYDTQGGYNHRGIDYFTWPFPWQLMDQGTVDVVAVAPGIVINAVDGNNDRSCSMNAPDTPNYVAVQHGDGTVARYLHMKNGSVAVTVGSSVVAGQRLGKVGSSGVSTGPHLHLELRASSSAGAAVIEPHNGTCNAVASAWTAQRPYRQPAVNRLSTHSGAPQSPSCQGATMPGTDTPNFKNAFMPGEAIVFMAAYRDQAPGQVTQFRVLRPDNSVHNSWNFDSASQNAPTYNASYWYWNQTLPANAPNGLWTFESTFQGVTKRHHFRVGNTTQAINDPRGLIGAWFQPSTSGQGIEIQWINDDYLLLFFYGHKDNGENFFLVGERAGRFDFNQDVVLSVYRTTGGRFNGLDPAQIQRPTWGTLTLRFSSCTAATATLAGIDGTQTLTLERLGRTTGLDCN